jgi:hypothetical protein
MMRLTVLRVDGDCTDGKTCPAIAMTDRDSYVLVGRIVTDPEALGSLAIGDGEMAVEVPASLLRVG